MLVANFRITSYNVCYTKLLRDLGAKAVEELLEKTGTKPEEVDMIICATVTPDHPFPATANIIADKVNIRNSYNFV